MTANNYRYLVISVSHRGTIWVETVYGKDALEAHKTIEGGGSCVLEVWNMDENISTAIYREVCIGATAIAIQMQEEVNHG